MVSVQVDEIIMQTSNIPLWEDKKCSRLNLALCTPYSAKERQTGSYITHLKFSLFTEGGLISSCDCMCTNLMGTNAHMYIHTHTVIVQHFNSGISIWVRFYQECLERWNRQCYFFPILHNLVILDRNCDTLLSDGVIKWKYSCKR